MGESAASQKSSARPWRTRKGSEMIPKEVWISQSPNEPHEWGSFWSRTSGVGRDPKYTHRYVHESELARVEAERDEALAELDELYQAAVEVVYHAKSAKADEGLEITGASRLDLAMKAYENRFRERLTTNQEARDG